MGFVESHTIGELLAVVTKEGAAALSRLLTGWVLVGPPPVDDGPAGEWSFRTISARTVRVNVGDVETMLNETFMAFPLKKAPSRAFASTLLIGRSQSNDVCLPFHSVSKLHARVRLANDGTLWMSDAGSSNGTAINGERLMGDEEKQLTHGALLRFGTCGLQLFESAALGAILKKFHAPH